MFFKPNKETLIELLKLFSVGYSEGYCAESNGGVITDIRMPMSIDGYIDGITSDFNYSCLLREKIDCKYYYTLIIAPTFGVIRILMVIGTIYRSMEVMVILLSMIVMEY